ncbi:unnamed protein product, partial [marine sediment metagenome]
MGGMSAILPNPADLHLDRFTLDHRGEAAGAGFAAVLAGAKRLGPVEDAAGAGAGAGADALTEEEEGFLQEVVEP